MNKIIEFLQRIGMLRYAKFKYKGKADKLIELQVKTEGLYKSQKDISKEVKAQKRK